MNDQSADPIEPKIISLHMVPPNRMRLAFNPWAESFDQVDDLRRDPVSGQMVTLFNNQPVILHGASVIRIGGQFHLLCFGQIIGSTSIANAHPGYAISDDQANSLRRQIRQARQEEQAAKAHAEAKAAKERAEAAAAIAAKQADVANQNAKSAKSKFEAEQAEIARQATLNQKAKPGEQHG